MTDSTGWTIYIGGNVTSSCGATICAVKNVGIIIYNNFFEGNAKGAWDIPANETVWNHAKAAVNQNIVGGPFLGGNYWDDYAGADVNGDGRVGLAECIHALQLLAGLRTAE